MALLSLYELENYLVCCDVSVYDIKRDVYLSLSWIRFSMTVLTLHGLHFTLCCGSAEPSLSFGSHGRQRELQEEAGLETT